MADTDEKEENWVLPYWKWVEQTLESYGKNAFEPIEEFSKWLGDNTNGEKELWACACCWLWIPLCLGYSGIVIAIFCVLATIFAFIGFCFHVVCLAIGILPGFLMVPWIIVRSFLTFPCYMKYHLVITYMNFEKGLFIKSAGFLLLLPFHLLFPCLMAVATTAFPVTSMVIAFFGCPITNWVSMDWVDNQYEEHFVTNVKKKVKEYKVVEEHNYGAFYWHLVEDILTTAIPKLANVAPLALQRHSDTKGTDIVKGIATVFFLLWAPILVIYVIPFAIIYVVFVVTFFLLGLFQSLYHICFGFLPGVLLAVFVSALSLLRLPRNIFLHLKIVVKTLLAGQIIKAINFFCLLPAQLLVPVLVSMVSLIISPLAAIAVSVLGFPKKPWIEMKTVGTMAWQELSTKVEDLAEKYDPGSSESYLETNLLSYYWSAVLEGLSLLEKVVFSPRGSIERPGKLPIRTAFCAPIWAVIAFFYALAVAFTFVVSVTPLVMIGIFQSIVLFALGIWPGFLIGLSFTAITTIRVPHNIYYHCLITYRTIMLRPNLKVMSFIFVPPTHFLVPFVIGALSFGGAVPTAAAASFAGFPHKAWSKVGHLTEKFWLRYVTQVKAHVENFGHETGIPENWDGKIYGLPVDPMTIVMAILFYAYGIPPVSIGLIGIVVLKSIPILLKCIVDFWNKWNYCTAIKDWAKMIVELFEYEACSMYTKIISEYSGALRFLDPTFVSESVRGYCEEFDFFPWIERNKIDACSALCLSPCILLTFALWITGLFGVIGLTVGCLLLGLFVWIMGWAITLVVPPVIYIGTWITCLFLIPIGYTFCWIVGFCFTLLFPWPCMALSMLTGPFLAVRVPFVFFKNNLLNPGELDQSIKTALRMPWEILKELDKHTGKLSLYNLTFCTHPPEEEREIKELETHTNFDYWRHVENKCKKEVGRVLEKNWLTSEDIEEQVKTLVAIPGFTVLAILVDSVKNEVKHKDPSLIYWDERDRCTQGRRIRGDNIVNHFFPLLVRAKGKLRDLADLEVSADFITAKFCDSADDPTTELKEFLRSTGVSANGKDPRMECKSELENLAHSLLRVKKVGDILRKISEHDFTKKWSPRLVSYLLGLFERHWFNVHSM